MFKKLKKIISNETLWQRIVFTFSILLVFRIGHYIKIPFAEINNVSSGSGFSDILNMASTFTGGNFSKACLFSLGVSPYISMSLIMTILKFIAKASDGAICSTLKKWDDEGTYGRIKFERLTRICATIASFLFAVLFLQFIPLKDNEFITKALFVMSMATGSVICIWLGDLITEKGIGNGISVLMFAGIVARIPNEFTHVYQSFQYAWKDEKQIFYLAFALYVLVYLAFIIFTCDVETTTRKINLQTTMKSKNSKKHIFPFSLKINFSGVMPVILASSLFAYSNIITSYVSENSIWYKIFNHLTYTDWIGLGVYTILIFLFSYMYSRVSFNAEEQAKNLKMNNQVIVGVRPGESTQKFLAQTIRNLSIIGGLTLVIIAVVPYLIPLVWDNSVASSISLGGTGLIIIVSVALESIKQINSQLREVKGFMDTKPEK